MHTPVQYRLHNLILAVSCKIFSCGKLHNNFLVVTTTLQFIMTLFFIMLKGEPCVTTDITVYNFIMPKGELCVTDITVYNDVILYA